MRMLHLLVMVLHLVLHHRMVHVGLLSLMHLMLLVAHGRHRLHVCRCVLDTIVLLHHHTHVRVTLAIIALIVVELEPVAFRSKVLIDILGLLLRLLRPSICILYPNLVQQFVNIVRLFVFHCMNI